MLDLFRSREAGRFGRRLKRARGARIPVTVVTGFLGAGKTTLVRRFLATPEGAGTEKARDHGHRDARAARALEPAPEPACLAGGKEIEQPAS